MEKGSICASSVSELCFFTQPVKLVIIENISQRPTLDICVYPGLDRGETSRAVEIIGEAAR